MNKRSDVVENLKPFLINHKNILTIWEGGSAATKSLDLYSDLDLMLVAEKKHIETLYQEIDAFFEKHYGIKESLRMPEPAWHGFSQKFYYLDQTEPYFYIDLCILPPNIKDRFTATDRHGVGVVWKDTISFVNPKPSDQEEVKQRAESFYNQAKEGSFVLRLEIEKALLRKNYLDSFHFMYSFMMRYLVPLLNIEHRIERVDFGIRYAEKDYSKSDVDLLLKFLKASNIETLEIVKEALFKRYEELKMKHHSLKLNKK